MKVADEILINAKEFFSFGQQIVFTEDSLPYNIMAVSDRFLIASRKLNRRKDSELLHFEVERGACFTFTEAYNAYKNDPVYTIVDFYENKRSTDDLIFGVYNYFSKESCEEALEELEKGELKLSRRNEAELFVNWGKTNFLNKGKN